MTKYILVLHRATVNNMQDVKGHYIKITILLVILLLIIKIIKSKLSCASFTIVFKFYFLLLYNKWLLNFLHAKHVYCPCKDPLTSIAILFTFFGQAPSSLSSIIFIKVDLPHDKVS